MKQNLPFKAGFIAVAGRPNVGKSTLINGFLGQKIAAVSPRPQTTRRRQLGILTLPNAQVIFIDTPGIHKPLHKLGEYMNNSAIAALKDADVILWLVDVNVPPTPEDIIVAGRLEALKDCPPVVLALNKVDLINDEEKLTQQEEAYRALFNRFSAAMSVSASGGANRQELLNLLIEQLPEGMPFFDEEQVTDFYEREIAADLIREAALRHLREEIPHAIAVRIDEFSERSEENAYIAATLMVEKDSHKGIVIGKGGSMLKQIGVAARAEIEKMSGRKIYLELRVKVNKNWRNDPNALKWLGYSLDSES